MAAALIPLVCTIVDRLLNALNNQVTLQDPMLLEEVRRYREQNAELIERYETLIKQMESKNIDSFEALAEYDKAAAAALVELAAKTKPFELVGNNIGLFGITSTGKSTMLNKLIGSEVAATGAGETTTEITSYQGTNFVLWDIPGRNDEITYLSMQYIALWKGLTKRLILITATIKENTNMMKLLDAIGLKYDIVVNKFDNVDEDERQRFRENIKKEIKDIGLKSVDHVFFVSAKYPTMFFDWKTMVDYLLKP